MLKKIVIGLVVLIALIIIVGFALPGSYEVSRSAVMKKASPEAVYAQVVNFHNWEAWDPWSQRDSSIVQSFEGPESGKGAIRTWTSERSGDGRMEIVAAEPNKRVEIELSFDQGSMAAMAAFDLEPVDGGTKVTWSMYGDFGMNPIARWFGLFFDGMIGPDYEAGLANLKKVVD